MTRLSCARCGKAEEKRVVYGLPDASLLKSAQRGEVVLGGCEMGTPIRTWLCDACAAELTEDERMVFVASRAAGRD